MADKTLPFTLDQIRKLIARYPTPFHIYDEKAIRANARRLKKAFSWAENFKEFFAVKACPNPHIIKILAEEGFGADASSYPELILAEMAGVTGDRVMFTSNDTPAREYEKAKDLGAILNLDDITHIPFVEEQCQPNGLPDLMCFRYNPGPLRGGNAIIGTPEQAKYGLTREQLFDAYRICRDKGVRRFGLHTMVASNELDPQYFIDTAIMLFDLVAEITGQLGIRFEFVNLGGGIGVPYRPQQQPVDLERVGEGVRKAYQEKIVAKGLAPLGIYMENGRMITGPYGYLVTTAIHEKNIYKNYIGLDACMANLMRPALYGAYHHITVMGKENAPCDHVYDVVGSLCENNDKFAIDRHLPKIDRGDIVVIHDAGAHGHAMGFNYNGKLRSAELMLREDGAVEMIRRAETIDDYFATLNLTA